MYRSHIDKIELISFILKIACGSLKKMCANKTVVECAKLRLLVTPASIHPTNGADTIYRPLQRMFKHDSLSRTLIFHQSKSWSPQIPFQNYIVVCILQAMRYALRWSYQRLQNWWENLEVSLWIPVQCWTGHNFCQTSYRGICVSFSSFFIRCNCINGQESCNWEDEQKVGKAK